MYLSTLVTSLPGDFAAGIRQVAELGFTHVDVVGVAERQAADVETLADSGLIVSCVAVGKGLPEGATLDAAALASRRSALETTQRQLADAARLGATCAYLVPGTDGSTSSLDRFAEACSVLADYAAERRVRLCLEHVPGRALARAETTLEWLEQLGHSNLFLLLDVGHCLISNEQPPQLIARAGARLGYVHFDDNDGAGDLHWPLLTGRLTDEGLQETVMALAAAKYTGALCLELNARNPEPVEALRQGKAMLAKLLGLVVSSAAPSNEATR